MTICRLIAIALLPFLAAPHAVHAQNAAPAPQAASSPQAVPSPQIKPITRTAPSAEDVATTPLSDLNIRKHEIPPALARAQSAPYSLAGMKSCAGLQKEISELTAILGEDVDGAYRRGKPIIPGKVAQDLVGGLIPFRGVVREISGANADNRALQRAIYAGFSRRAFLKGVGLQRRCAYPARPR